MASRTMLVILVLLLVLVVVEEASAAGCHNNGKMRCYYPKPTTSVEIKSRKMVVDGSPSSSYGELRTVPSGPDPLHHNGATPKKPTSP